MAERMAESTVQESSPEESMAVVRGSSTEESVAVARGSSTEESMARGSGTVESVAVARRSSTVESMTRRRISEESNQEPDFPLESAAWSAAEVLSADSGLRLDKYLSQSCPELSRSYLQKLVADGRVAVNGAPVKSSYKVNAGDQIVLEIPEPVEPEILAEDIPLDILYEDGDVILVNKPKGMVVHPAAGHYSGTLVNALLWHCQGELSGINGAMRPGIVHRIDRDTTGVLIVCKNDFAHGHLAAQLKEHSVTRRYRAIVHGNLKEDDGTVDAPIGRHPSDRKKMSINEKNGREAVTHYHVLERFGSFTYIECRLETGRTHQIRVHMASVGHPLLGDEVYGPAKCPYKLRGQTLHAEILGFVHPRTGEYMEFHAPLPEYFGELLINLRKF